MLGERKEEEGLERIGVLLCGSWAGDLPGRQ